MSISFCYFGVSLNCIIGRRLGIDIAMSMLNFFSFKKSGLSLAHVSLKKLSLIKMQILVPLVQHVSHDFRKRCIYKSVVTNQDVAKCDVDFDVSSTVYSCL